MADRILKLRELNRATLARQMLLEREAMALPEAIERLVGLQAQLGRAPYVGLWTRLRDFGRETLDHLIESRRVINATWMRATLHLCTTDDYVRFRTTLQPMLTWAASAIAKRRAGDFEIEKLLAAAREYLGEKPRTFVEISEMVTKLMPDQDVGALRADLASLILIGLDIFQNDKRSEQLIVTYAFIADHTHDSKQFFPCG
jgi:uncharacterized protein YcaQ